MPLIEMRDSELGGRKHGPFDFQYVPCEAVARCFHGQTVKSLNYRHL